MLLSIKERITHVHCIVLGVTTILILETYQPWDLSPREIDREHVIRLESLIMSIDWLNGWSVELQIKVHEALGLLVYMVDREENLRCF